jgi:hypothetical protein
MHADPSGAANIPTEIGRSGTPEGPLAQSAGKSGSGSEWGVEGLVEVGSEPVRQRPILGGSPSYDVTEP